MRPMQLTLRAGERIYVNGAVLRVDRKVTLQLLNDVSFLLEAHVMQASQTVTPLRQLYFVLQAVLLDPVNAEPARALFREMQGQMAATLGNKRLLAGLAATAELEAANRIFEALRSLRALFPVEDAILAEAAQPSPQQAA
jgi:flagellar protein FlbT